MEALYTQDSSYKSILPSHSLLSTGIQSSKDLDVVPRPDWEKYSSKTAERLLSEQTPQRLLEIRGMLYELLVHCIPATLVLASITRRLLDRVDEEIKPQVVHWSAFYDHRLRQGNKPIFHLEG